MLVYVLLAIYLVCLYVAYKGAAKEEDEYIVLRKWPEIKWSDIFPRRNGHVRKH